MEETGQELDGGTGQALHGGTGQELNGATGQERDGQPSTSPEEGVLVLSSKNEVRVFRSIEGHDGTEEEEEEEEDGQQMAELGDDDPVPFGSSQKDDDDRPIFAVSQIKNLKKRQTAAKQAASAKKDKDKIGGAHV